MSECKEGNKGIIGKRQDYLKNVNKFYLIKKW